MDTSSKEKQLKILFRLASFILIMIVLVLIFGFEKDLMKKPDQIGLVMVKSQMDKDWQEVQFEALKSACEEVGAKFYIKQDVPENAVIFKNTVTDVINHGANMVFIASYPYSAPLKNIANEHPDISFATDLVTYNAPNMSSYTVRMYQGRYLTGAIAAMRTKSNVIGYVAPIPTSEVNLEINAFTLGAQKINPNVKIFVIWTNSWKNSSKEEENTKRLIQEVHADVITYHQEDQVVAETAEALNIEYIGYNNISENVSEKQLTSLNIHWDIYYSDIVNNYLKGELNYLDNNWLDINNGAFILTNYSPLITPEMKMKVEVLRQHLLNGHHVFSGLIYDNQNNIRCEADETISDHALIKHTNWLVKGAQILE